MISPRAQVGVPLGGTLAGATVPLSETRSLRVKPLHAQLTTASGCQKSTVTSVTYGGAATSAERLWVATEAVTGKATPNNYSPNVLVRVEPHSGFGKIPMIFLIGLFLVCTSGVALMWRQVGQPVEQNRTTWQNWRQKD